MPNCECFHIKPNSNALLESLSLTLKKSPSQKQKILIFVAKQLMNHTKEALQTNTSYENIVRIYTRTTPKLSSVHNFTTVTTYNCNRTSSKKQAKRGIKPSVI